MIRYALGFTCRAIACTTVLVAVSMAAPAFAGEYPFGYVYTTDIHPKGQKEVEQWVTRASGQSRGEYNNTQYRTELEYGITDKLQGSLYLNYNTVNANANEPNGETGGKFVPDGVEGPYHKSFYDSTSAEFIYRVKSPYKDGYGLAFYVEPTYGPKKRELETKVILQKNFMEDRLVWAGNATVAAEKEKYSGEWEKETELEFSTGLAYNVAPGWHVGVEAVNRRGYEGHSLASNKREYSAWFAGPTVHYANKQWWATLTWLPQLKAATGYTEEAREQIVNGRIFHEAGTNQEIRLKVGYNF